MDLLRLLNDGGVNGGVSGGVNLEELLIGCWGKRKLLFKFCGIFGDL